MSSAQILNNDDRCRRAAFYSLKWQAQLIRPVDALYASIEKGLEHSGESDPWDIAGQHVLDLAVDRGFDSNQVELLQEADHLSSLASFITYVLRPDGPWKRPEPIPLPDGTIWTPGAFLDASETHLRRLVLCSRWDAYRMVEEEHDWRTLEGSIYGVPIDLVVVVLGQERDGRRHGPLSKGWRHPVSKQLRFRKRDGGDFDGNWEKIWRERGDFTKEQWLDALAEDVVLPDVIQIHNVPVSERAEDWKELAQNKLERIRKATQPPEESPSMCFDRINPCPFRSACPRGEEPSESLGFVNLHHAANIAP